MTDLMPEPVVDLDVPAEDAPATAAAGPDTLDALDVIDEQLLDTLVYARIAARET